MFNIYYKIWVDGLLKMKSLPKNKGMWKLYGMTFMSMAMALNIMLFMTILQNVLNIHFYNLNLDIFKGTKLDAILSFFILFLAPPLILNYLLIFHKKRYEELFKLYKTYDGKLYASYLVLSYFLPVVLLIGGKIIHKINK
ncbi:hypothetical protein GR160_13670 [Flavobacterium sp. Sd200]|uniref:hypothetical protein n=1 Tax=Flavobacterium sp. Sd200 TaxID=2692211 RepID=UPI0013722778|nr:hypothetical protein [Flavobacterium sp. Sd200]MXN92273.1 hypothetical protein [Flavobacterium sp. Sd200]